MSLGGLRLISAFGDRRVVGPPRRRRAFGVPPGGPFDRLSAALANALLNLPDDASILEIAIGPVVFEAEGALTLAVVGGPDGAFPLRPGERFEVRPAGARAYVAVKPLSPLGGSAERGDAESFALSLGVASQVERSWGEGSRRLANPPRLGDAPLRVVAGPQADLLDLPRFLAGSYTVGLASNRVGVRLSGEAMPHTLSLPSEPAIPGVVQVPPSGEPIVLGPDGPTIGGYPKVTVVIDADLDRIGRARPGERVEFRLVSFEEARAAADEARLERERRCAELRILQTQ